MRGNSTSPKIAVHSSCSPEVSSGDRRVRCKEAKDSCRIWRHGFVHCVVRARKMGDQYAAQASLLSRWDCFINTGMRDVNEYIILIAETPRATAASTLYEISRNFCS